MFQGLENAAICGMERGMNKFCGLMVVAGLACAWAIVRRGGWWGRLLDAFSLAPLVHQETAIYGLVVAGIWQGSGVTMAIRNRMLSSE